jgi:hypothetical protein
MKIAEVLAVETDANDAQLQSIKQQERALKIRKAQLKANKAQQQLRATLSR